MRLKLFSTLATALLLLSQPDTQACTGISLTAKDGSPVLARTIEWGGSELNSQYVIVPRNYTQQMFTSAGEGMSFTTRFGYVGLAVEQKEFVAEGINEAGLAAGLFYFPGYGKYEDYDAQKKASSVSDLQLVSWMLGNFATIDEVKAAIEDIHVVAIDPRASTVHWRIADTSGREVVLEIIDGKPQFYENPIGVLTNSPGFEWQLTNLNNYVNLFPGGASAKQMGQRTVAPFGAGSGFLGIPGDVTPPSRFVRAAFYKTSAPQQATSRQTVMQCFQILNNFDIPIGIEFSETETPTDIPSATQWTSATDIRNRKIYYRTMYNSTIRCIDLNEINFENISYQAFPLDKSKEQAVEMISVLH